LSVDHRRARPLRRFPRRDDGRQRPLNDELADAGNPDRIADLAAVRDDFEDPWVAWNIVRTVVSTLALGCLAWALCPLRA
jgi:uncharacterized membrane protein